MSHLLKRTKKTCLKFFRKLSASKQMHTKKLEEEEISTNNIMTSANFDANCPPSAESQQPEMEPRLSLKLNSIETLPLPDNHQCTSYDNYAVQEFEPEVETATELKGYSFIESKNQNNTVLQSLTSKLFLTADGYEFRRLQQLRSDTVSEVVQFEPEFEYHEEEGERDGLVFEKVKFKQHVRYFRHTPSSSSLDNFLPSNTSTTIECGAFRTYHSNRINNSNMSLQQHHNIAQYNPYLPVNVSLGSKLNGNYQNVIISEERNCYNKLTPVVKWDINGNSLDEDDIFINDNWDDFDIKLGQSQDKRLAQFNISDDSQKSSHRSSSTTLETWLEDELLESSYNERHDVHCNFCLMKA